MEGGGGSAHLSLVEDERSLIWTLSPSSASVVDQSVCSGVGSLKLLKPGKLNMVWFLVGLGGGAKDVRRGRWSFAGGPSRTRTDRHERMNDASDSPTFPAPRSSTLVRDGVAYF